MQYDFIDREFFYDFIDGFIDGDFSKEHKTMKLQDAKFFLATLEKEGLMYHLDDRAVDCLNQVNNRTIYRISGIDCCCYILSCCLFSK